MDPDLSFYCHTSTHSWFYEGVLPGFDTKPNKKSQQKPIPKSQQKPISSLNRNLSQSLNRSLSLSMSCWVLITGSPLFVEPYQHAPSSIMYHYNSPTTRSLIDFEHSYFNSIARKWQKQLFISRQNATFTNYSLWPISTFCLLDTYIPCRIFKILRYNQAIIHGLVDLFK